MRSFMRLADLCNQRQKDTCKWIFDNEKYTSWLFGIRRNLYCVGPGMFEGHYVQASYEFILISTL
jgi:hypothetical protein